MESIGEAGRARNSSFLEHIVRLMVRRDITTVTIC